MTHIDSCELNKQSVKEKKTNLSDIAKFNIEKYSHYHNKTNCSKIWYLK